MWFILIHCKRRLSKPLPPLKMQISAYKSESGASEELQKQSKKAIDSAMNDSMDYAEGTVKVEFSSTNSAIFEVSSGSVQRKMLTHRDTLVNSAFSALIIEDKDAPAHESEGKRDQRHKDNKKLIYNRSNTLRQFDLFCSIHSKLAKRKTLWDEAGINRLRDEISDFSFLYISLNGVAKVSIYLHLLFNGTI